MSTNTLDQLLDDMTLAGTTLIDGESDAEFVLTDIHTALMALTRYVRHPDLQGQILEVCAQVQQLAENVSAYESKLEEYLAMNVKKLEQVEADGGSYVFDPPDHDGVVCCRWSDDESIHGYGSNQSEALDDARKVHLRVITQRSMDSINNLDESEGDPDGAGGDGEPPPA